MDKPSLEFAACGLSHHTAPVDVREQAALHGDDLETAVRRAAEVAGRGEALIVSTCNRVELYVAAQGDAAASSERARQAMECVLSDVRRLDPNALRPHLYAHGGEAAVRHLFRVAASLDSLVVGEPQILGQVKDAWQVASKVGTVGNVLSRALPRAFAAAKRVRSETEVARSAASVASAAVELGQHIFGELRGKEVLVVGAGKMGDLAARHLVSAGAWPLAVINRTLARGQALAERIGGNAWPWEQMAQLLTTVDIVLCSTGAPEPVIRREMVHKAMKARRGRWLCFIDIAVPRDVEPEVGELENVYLYDVDALSQLVDEHLSDRRKAAEEAESIVAEEVARFIAAERSLGVVPTIKALRERFMEVARAEAARTLGKMDGASERERKEIERLADSIINKLLHAPLTALKRESDSDALAAAVRTLFALDEGEASGAEPKAGAGSR